jgi:hypothetical protein
MAPGATPPDIVRRLQEAFRERRYRAIGGGPSVEFAAFIAHEQRGWKEVLARANIRADQVCKYRYGRQSCASQSA